MNHLPNLLIVDDNRVNLALLGAIIRKINVNLINALSGQEALQKTRGIELALAIIDVRMPGMNGFELATELNKERAGNEVPVIFLTASEFNETDVFKGYDSGAVDFIFKPVNNKILTSKIKVFLDLFDQKQTIIKNNELLKESYDEIARANDTVIAIEAKVYMFFDRSPVGSVIVGPDKYFIRCNAAFCDFVGYTEDELTRKTFLDITHPEDTELGIKEGEQMLRGEIESFYFEKRFISKDGNILWGEVNINLFRDANNKILYYLSTIQDITQRKRGDAELRLQSEILRNMVEAVYIVRLEDGEIVYTNLQFDELFGYERGEMLNKHVSVVNAPAAKSPKETVKEIMDNLLENGFWNGEVNNIRKDGTAFWSYAKVSLYDHSQFGKVLISVHEDITQRKQSEEDLKKSEERYRSLVENIGEGVVFVNDEETFVFANRAAEEIFGLNIGELRGKCLKNFLSDSNIELIKNESKKRRQGESSVFEHEIVLKDGSKKDLIITATPDFENGKFTGTYASFLDFTERKKTEEKLQHLNEELEDRVNERTSELLESNAAIQKTRQNYETFFNTIDDFLFVLDELGNIIHTNNTVIDRLGYTTEEITGKSVLMVYPPELHDEVAVIVGEILSGISDTCNLPVITKSGVKIPVESKASHGLWDSKTVIFYVTKDISKIKFSEEKFSKIFYLSPSACGLRCLADNKYVEVNEAFYTLLGYNKDEVIGTSESDLGIFSDESINVLLKKADNNGNIANAEVSLKAKNGDIKHVLLSAENIIVQDENYRLIVAHDITRRKLAEAALRESESSLAKAQQIAHIGSWTFEEMTQKLWWSDETFRIFGFAPGEIKPTIEGFLNCVHPDDQSLLQEAITSAWDQHPFFSIDHRIILPDRAERSVHEQAEGIYDNTGQPKRWMGTVQDISEKIQIQKNIIKAIVQTEEKERAYFSKELHDGLGPLLSTIKLYLQWSQRPKSNKSQDEIIKEAQGILEESIATVKEISNRLSPHILANFGLTSAIQGFADHLSESSPIKISIQSNVARRLDSEIETTLYRAIIECINNTIKHAGANNITITLNDCESELQIRYTDDGIGFNYEEKLSDHNGLGLFNLLNRIKNIGGKITMFSKPGEGVDYQIVVI